MENLRVLLIRHQNPEHAYEINFEAYLPQVEEVPDLDPRQRVHEAAKSLFHFIGVVFYATLDSACSTMRHSVSSFRHLVFSSYGITDFYLAAFKVAFWVFGLGYTFVATASRTVIKEYFPENPEQLRRFMPEGMDPHHIQSTEVTLDVSGVPEEIQVRNLLALFEEIEFEDASRPEYIPPSFHGENGRVYTREELQESLNTFVTYVNERRAFLGTPPAYDTIKLMAFYQQIEDAVRLSIQKVSEDLTNFREKNQQAIEAGDEDTIGSYKSLLEDQARLVIDLAISGKHCGARYMGEAMTRYNYLYAESSRSDTLQDSLITLLGDKRNTIAQAQIQMHFGGQRQGADTHSYAQYMQQMGRLLAIPGTGNIVEHLGGLFRFDSDYYLREFFQEYTESTIGEAVQEKVKSSQHFREQICDWLKGQSGEWRPEDQKDPVLLVEQLQAVIDEGIVDTSALERLVRLFEELLGTLKAKGTELPPQEDWLNFIQELMALPEAKEWFNGTQDGLEGLKVIQRRMELIRRRQKFTQELTDPLLEGVLRNCVPYEAPISFDRFGSDLTKIAKVEQMRRILPLDGSVFMRILNQEAELSAVVHDHFRVSNQSDFFGALMLNNIHEAGLPPLILKWLLCAHHITIPEGPEEVVDLQEDDISENDLQAFLDEVYPRIAERVVWPAGEKNRHLDLLFNIAFLQKPNEVSSAAEWALPSRDPFYPRWKIVFCINIPKSGAEFFGSPLLKVATSIFLIYKTVQFLKEAYAYNKTLVDRAKVYLENNTSTKTKAIAFRARAIFSDCYQWVLNNRLRLFIYALIGKAILTNAPFDSVRRLGRRVDPWQILPDIFSMYNFFISFAFGIVSIGWNAANQMSSSLKALSDQSQQERSKISRKISYSLWRDRAGYV